MKKAGVGPVTVTFLLEAGDTVGQSLGTLIKSQLAPIGIRVNIVTQSGADWFTTATKGGYGLLSTYFSASVDPALAYYLLAYSTSAFNLAGRKSATIDGLLNDFTFQSSQSIREKYYPELVNAVAEDASIIFIANQQQQYWTVPTLQGSAPYPDLTIRAYDMWLK
jgi:ABC-type transport system substrate-binding protein